MEFLLQIDGQILLFIQEHIRQEWMTPLWRAITHLADGGRLWLIVSLLLLFSEKTRKVGAAALVSLAIGALLTNVMLKNLVARTRPYEIVEGLRFLIPQPHDYSFPSGHTCSSFAAAFVYDKKLPRYCGATALILAALVAFSRLYLGVHYPTDILGGLAVGWFSAWAALRICESSEKNKGSRQI